MPLLPVFPGGIHAGIAGRLPPFAVGGAISVPDVPRVNLSLPARAESIVQIAFRGVAEDVVGGDNEAVALGLGQVGDPVMERVVMPVGVVKLDELVEARLVVGFRLGLVKDLVGRGVRRRWPASWAIGEGGLVAMHRGIVLRSEGWRKGLLPPLC